MSLNNSQLSGNKINEGDKILTENDSLHRKISNNFVALLMEHHDNKQNNKFYNNSNNNDVKNNIEQNSNFEVHYETKEDNSILKDKVIDLEKSIKDDFEDHNYNSEDKLNDAEKISQGLNNIYESMLSYVKNSSYTDNNNKEMKVNSNEDKDNFDELMNMEDEANIKLAESNEIYNHVEDIHNDLQKEAIAHLEDKQHTVVDINYYEKEKLNESEQKEKHSSNKFSNKSNKYNREDSNIESPLKKELNLSIEKSILSVKPIVNENSIKDHSYKNETPLKTNHSVQKSEKNNISFKNKSNHSLHRNKLVEELLNNSDIDKVVKENNKSNILESLHIDNDLDNSANRTMNLKEDSKDDKFNEVPIDYIETQNINKNANISIEALSNLLDEESMRISKQSIKEQNYSIKQSENKDDNVMNISIDEEDFDSINLNKIDNNQVNHDIKTLTVTKNDFLSQIVEEKHLSSDDYNYEKFDETNNDEKEISNIVDEKTTHIKEKLKELKQEENIEDEQYDKYDFSIKSEKSKKAIDNRSDKIIDKISNENKETQESMEIKERLKVELKKLEDKLKLEMKEKEALLKEQLRAEIKEEVLNEIKKHGLKLEKENSYKNNVLEKCRSKQSKSYKYNI